MTKFIQNAEMKRSDITLIVKINKNVSAEASDLCDNFDILMQINNFVEAMGRIMTKMHF